MEARAGSRTGRPSCTSTPTVPGPRSYRGSHAFGSRQGSLRPARRADREVRNAQASARMRKWRAEGNAGGWLVQRPGRTENMLSMYTTCATSQSRGWLKLEASCQVRRRAGEEYSGVRRVQRRGARVRWRDGSAARAYPEHVFHVRDLRDVPVQGLVEAGGALPGAERGRRGLLRPARGVQRRRAAGKAGGSRAVARWGSGPGVPRTCGAC